MNLHRLDRSPALIVAAVVLLVGVAFVASVESGVTPARKCAAAKVKAAAAKAAAKLACHRKAITKGVEPDDTCLADAEAKFAKAFAAIEAKGGCVTTDDADAVESTVDDFVDQVVTAVAPDAVFVTPTPTMPGPTSTPAPTPTCVTPLTHSNGVGNDYLDCGALGTPGDASTYTVFMATEARDAWPIGPSTTRDLTCGDGATAACTSKRTKGACGIWCYSGALAGFVHASTDRFCVCPTTADPTWN